MLNARISSALASKSSRQKFRSDGVGVGKDAESQKLFCNVMYDPRVVRGNTCAVPTKKSPDLVSKVYHPSPAGETGDQWPLLSWCCVRVALLND